MTQLYVVEDKQNVIRYAGVTRDIQLRRKMAWYMAKKNYDDKPLHVWMRTLSIPPLYRVIAIVEYSERLSAEERLIRKLWETGQADLNVIASHGDVMRWPEIAAKVSVSLTGREFSPEHRANLSVSHTGRPLSEQQREMISRRQKGRQKSEQERANISASHTGQSLSEQHRKAVSEGMKRNGAAPAFCLDCGEGPFRGTHGLGVHRARMHRKN
jgi:hypothetical protein